MVHVAMVVVHVGGLDKENVVVVDSVGAFLLVVIRRRMDLSDTLAARPSLGSEEEPFIPW